MRLIGIILSTVVLFVALSVGIHYFEGLISHTAAKVIASSVINGDPLDPTRLPLGDGRVGSSPQRGYVMSCQNRFGGGGAFRDGDWIRSDGTWDSTGKPIVEGDVAWDGKYEIKVEDGKRKLIGNGLPNHHTGVFPIQSGTEAFKYDRNPNSIAESKISFDLPLMPQLAASPSCVQMGTIGVMKSGVAIFNALDGEGRDAVAHEIQDKCNGHPQRDGHYHYHDLSKCLDDNRTKGHSELVGYALDGFGIFGMFGEEGKQLTNADLDECHGHSHEIIWDGQKVGMYHYHATLEYPYTVGCFKGTPIRGRQIGPPRGGQGPGGPGGPGGPPPPFGRPGE